MIYIKIAGAILVIAASFGIGTTIGMYQTRRTEDIHELLLLIGIINGNLAYSATEITDIIEQGAKKTKGGVSVWLADILDRLTMDYNETFEDKWLKKHSHPCPEQLFVRSFDLSGGGTWKMALLYGR